MHRVKYDISWTRNMGNFESLKVNLGLEEDGGGHPDATLAKVRKWVEEQLSIAVEEVSAQISGEAPKE